MVYAPIQNKTPDVSYKNLNVNSPNQLLDFVPRIHIHDLQLIYVSNMINLYLRSNAMTNMKATYFGSPIVDNCQKYCP